MQPKLIFKTTLLLLLLFPLLSFAQKSYKLSGKVVDNSGGIPLEYATITLIDETGEKTNQGGITNFDGEFNFDVTEGTYTIKVEYISFEPKIYKNRHIDKKTNMGTVVLQMSSANLDEVVVTAETTQVDVRLDKKIYNIGKDLTTQGSTISDALNNVPSVNVDVEGGISLRGNDNVRILINGKPSAMAGFGSTDVFQQLPADAIERVEVITSPSARYDAEGTAGILNIILKKEKTLGFNGSISANVGYPEQYGLSANLNLRTDKFNIFNTTGVYLRKSPGNAYFNNVYKQSTGIDKIIEDREYDRQYKGIYTNIGMEYFLTESSSITGSFYTRFGDDKDVTENANTQYLTDASQRKNFRKEIEKEKDQSYQASLNYTNSFNDEGHKFTADFQYSYDKEKRPTTIEENLVHPTNQLIAKERINEKETQNEFLIQADYVLPMGDAQFEAGYRGNFEKKTTDYLLDTLNRNSNIFELNERLSNTFIYHENVNAIYTQYGNKFGNFSFLAGLRLEHTQLKGDLERFTEDNQSLEEELGVAFKTNFDKNYLGLFPTLNFIYELDENQNISLGYNRRINRPRGWFINPNPSRSSRTNIFQGNPDLDPAYSSTFDLGYLKQWEKLTLTGSVYYQHETDSFERVVMDTGKETSDGQKIIRTMPINLSTEERIGAEFSVIYNPEKWLRLNGSFNIFNFDKEGIYDGVDYSAKSTSWFARFSSKVTLPGSVDWQTNAFYRGPQKNAQTESDGIFSLNLAFSKEIIKNKATLSFNISDVLNSRKRNSTTETATYWQESEFQWRERQFSLSLIYRFNQPKNQRQRGQNNNGGFDDGDGGF